MVAGKINFTLDDFASTTNLKSWEGIMPFFFSKDSNRRSGTRLRLCEAEISNGVTGFKIAWQVHGFGYSLLPASVTVV